jgi:3-hydroxyacyl-[acyl-carrier-protein] dehydratase
VPGVILCEMMAQGACVLLADLTTPDMTPMFTSLDKVRFKNPVRPGDTLESESTVIKHKGPFYWCAAKGYVNGKLCVSAEFSFALVKNESK